MKELWNWIVRFIEMLFSGGKLKRIKIGDKVFMPLFFPKSGGGVGSTWAYMRGDEGWRSYLRSYIMLHRNSGETPAICFLLTPDDCNGGFIPNNIPVLNEGQLAAIHARVVELVREGIAVFPCLYNDDPNGNMPRWWEMEQHLAVWKQVHAKIGDLVTGYILSIESNEKKNLGGVQHYIQMMRDIMPGVPFYGTHVQWKARGSPYYWDGGNVPFNANIILVETSNDPNQDVSADHVLREYNDIKSANPNLKFVMHEYNLNVNSQNFNNTRSRLRSSGAWGIG